MTGFRLSMSREDLASVIDHARACYPREAVGLLGGAPSGEVTSVHPIQNIGPAGTFLAEPFEQWRALQDLERRGQHLLAVYHSHPDGGITPSPTDLYFARAVALVYVILAVKAGASGPVSIGAYDVRHGECSSATIDVR